MRYYLIAGEASGDLHGSNLISSLACADPQAEFRFFGGDLMQAAGGTCVRHYRELAYMGIWPVLTHLGTIIRSGKQCFRDIQSWRPDCVILIDYPGFNLSIAKKVRSQLGIPVYYYISPKIWAWKSYRIRSIKRDVTELFSILPFEKEWFAERGYNVRYVGNPCVDAVEKYRNSKNETALPSAGRPSIALLAGSRRQEISRNLPNMIEAVKDLEDYDIVLAAAPGISDEFYDEFLRGTRIRVVRDRTYQVLDGARAALVTSGTATLETALLRVPQVVCYHLPAHWLVVLFGKFILKTKFISLVNLIAGRQVVPELIAANMSAAAVRSELLPLLDETPQRKAQLDGCDEVISILGPAGASDKAAKQITELLGKR